MQKSIYFAQADHILAKACQMPFLAELKERMDNALHIAILSAAVDEDTDICDSCGNPDVDQILARCKPIVPDTSQRFDIIFEDYIIYQVRNESFSSFDEAEERTGRYLVQFQKSHFLDYLSVATDACQLEDGSFYPAPWKHYGIYTQNHVVDIIAQEEPKVLYSGNEPYSFG